MGWGWVPGGGGAGGPARRQVGWCLAGSGPGAVKRGGHNHCGVQAGEEGGGGGIGHMGCNRRARGPAQRNSSFFDLIKVISNGIDLIQIKHGLPKI
jgi:hypothetical protein